MKRRGFFGLMGGAVVAGPSMAKAAATQGLEALQLGPVGGMPFPPSAGYTTGAYPENSDGPSPLDPEHWMQRELSDFLGVSARELAERRLETHVHALDPDLAVMRSLSLDAKIRIQRDRQFTRERESQRRYLSRNIERAIKNWSGR